MRAEDQSEWKGRKQYCRLENGRTLSFIRNDGVGPSFLLIHGFSDSSRSFSLLTPYLAEANLVIPDLVGHGQSSQPDSGYGLDMMSDDIAGLMRAINGAPPIVVGHSLGAMVALRLARRHPKLMSAIVMISGALKPAFSLDHPLRFWAGSVTDPINPNDVFFEGWHHCTSPIEDTFLKYIRKEAAAIPSRIWRKLIGELDQIDLIEDAKNADIAAFMISGDADEIFGPSHMQALEVELKPLDHQTLKNFGHNPHWENPELVASILVKFAAELKTKKKKI